MGDASSIDSLIQNYCLSLDYFNITIYYISSQPRFKTSDKFNLKQIQIPSEINGFRAKTTAKR